MKIRHATLAFIILCASTSSVLTLDFLDDPFFKQLASELDAMFGTEEPAAPAKPAAPAAPRVDRGSFPPVGQKPGAADLNGKKDEQPIIPDSAKDMRTLFIENLGGAQASKPAAPTFGRPTPQKQAKVVISKERLKAYHFYMGDLVKKARLIERCVASNPGRTFGHSFLVAFDALIDAIDQIETTHHLVLSKKMYLRAFFMPPLQKTREKIVTLHIKLDAALKKIRPLLSKEESLDDDIALLRKEATGKAKKHPKPQKKATPPAGKKLPLPLLRTGAAKPFAPANAKHPAAGAKPLPPKKATHTSPQPTHHASSIKTEEFSLKSFLKGNS